MSIILTDRYRAILPLIDRGHGAVYSIAEALPQYHISAIRTAVTNLAKKYGLIRVIRRAHSGVPARYALTCSLDEALARVEVKPAARPSFDALQAALGTPDGISAMLATRATPRIVQRMGKWDAPMGRPKKAARACA